MIRFNKKTQYSFLVGLISCLVLGGCSNKTSGSIFRSLQAEEDGVIAVGIDDIEPVEEVEINIVDQISSAEKSLIDELHEGEYKELSFILVNIKDNSVLKSYQSLQPRILASVSKVPLSLAALQNVDHVNHSRISEMLKNSHNGEASRYGRLAAKAIDGTTIPTPPYVEPHSCPSEAYKEGEIGDSIFQWVQSEMPNVDWLNAALKDSAGCSRENQMSAAQVVSILNYADRQGPIFGGQSFVGMLAVAGQDGTLANRNTDHKGMIFAKTGTLTPVSNLAGYIHVKRDGAVQRYYFAILVSKKGSGDYTSQARKLIESLVRLWANQLLSGEPEALYKMDFSSP